jgi:hypothetical protein
MKNWEKDLILSFIFLEMKKWQDSLCTDEQCLYCEYNEQLMLFVEKELGHLFLSIDLTLEFCQRALLLVS